MEKVIKFFKIFTLIDYIKKSKSSSESVKPLPMNHFITMYICILLEMLNDSKFYHFGKLNQNI